MNLNLSDTNNIFDELSIPSIYYEEYNPDFKCTHGSDDSCIACNFEMGIIMDNCNHNFIDESYGNPNSGAIVYRCLNCPAAYEQKLY